MFTFPVGFFGGVQTIDPFWGNVVLYLPLTGSDGQATFTDVSSYNHAVVRNGNTIVSTAQAPALTGVNSSTYFDGSGDFLQIANSTPLVLAGGAWTIECFVRPTGDYSIYRAIYAKRVTSSISTSYEGYLRVTSGFASFFNGTLEYVSTNSPALNAWTYLAWVYSGSVLQIWAGTSGATTKVLESAVTIVDVNEPLVIGGTRGYTEWFFGHISHLRITKGISRDVSTVPTAPFPIG